MSTQNEAPIKDNAPQAEGNDDWSRAARHFREEVERLFKEHREKASGGR